MVVKASALGLAAALTGGGRRATFAAGARAADAPTLEIVSPTDGATVNSNDIQVQLKVGNITLDPTAFGRPDKDGVGEILALIDGATTAQLANFYSTESFCLAGDGLAPGKHVLTFVLASNTHVPMMDTAKQITVDFQPAQPIPLPAADDMGDTGITLISPKDGETVPASFPVQITPVNFFPSSALEGKTNVPGYGHYHVFVDTPMDPAMNAHTSLAGLVLMPGTNGFALNLSAWGEGKHTIWIEPAQNDHSRYQPLGHVEFTVNVSASATPGATPGGTPVAGVHPAAASATSIKMTDQLQFSPSAATINVGDTVTWHNESAIPHSTTDDPPQNPVAKTHPEFSQLPAGAKAWNSGLLQTGQTFSHTFKVPGTYHYFCIPHVLSGMLGTISVQG